MNTTIGMNDLLPFNCHHLSDKVIILLIGSQSSTAKVAEQFRLTADAKFNIHVTESLPLDPGSTLWRTRIDSIVFVVDMFTLQSLDVVESGLQHVAVEYLAGRHVHILSLLLESYKQQVEVSAVGSLARSYQCGFYMGSLLQPESLQGVVRQLWGSARAGAGQGTKHTPITLHALGQKY